MKQINRFTLKHLAHGGHLAFHSTVLQFLEKQQAVADGMADELTAYKTAYGQERSIYPYRRGSSITKQMVAAKQLRIELHLGLKFTVKAAACHWDEARRKAGKTMKKVIEHFGDLYKQNMIEATANAGLLVNTSRGQYAGQVALLGLGEWLDRLEEANNRFNEYFLSRSREESQKPKMRMTEARPALDAAYRELAEMLNAYVLVKGEAEYAPIIDFINALIADEKLKLAQHVGRVRKKRRKEEAGNEAGGGEEGGLQV